MNTSFKDHSATRADNGVIVDTAAPACKRVSLIVPCFDESETVEHLAAKLAAARKKLSHLDIELVLVDDGSTDDTLEKLKECFVDFDNVIICSDGMNRGVSGAIMQGIRAASNDIVCSMDSDCTYSPDQIRVLLDHLSDDISMVIGSPYHPQGRVTGVPAWRIGISKSAAGIYRFFLKSKLRCYTSCFRAYRKKDIEDVELAFDGFTGTAEMVWRLEQKNLKTIECPAELSTRDFGQSKSRLIPVSLNHFSLIRKIAMTRILRRY
jgi:dolichol-phosphate mannosyltransferase